MRKNFKGETIGEMDKSFINQDYWRWNRQKNGEAFH